MHTSAWTRALWPFTIKLMKTIRHEQAIAVCLAYVIGFTTAFIGFGLNQDRHGEWKKVAPEEAAPASAVNAASGFAVEVVKKDGGLFMLKDGQERIISAVSSGNESGPGYHRAIVAASVSPSGRYIHYCAETDGEDVCTNFVYSVDADSLYVIKESNEPVISHDGEAAATSWSADDTLLVNGSVTVGAETSWRVR